MLFWNRPKINKTSINQANLDSVNLVEEEIKAGESVSIVSGNDFLNYVPQPILQLGTGCEYPLKISDHFPIWANKKPEGQTGPNLVELVTEYYNWIACATKQNITPIFGFFELEKFKKINELPDDLFFLYAKLYIPSIPNDALQNDVSIQELKTLLNGIRKKLYSIKGSEFSFKYLISLFFTVTPDDIYIVYPKKYLMVLNGGVNSELSGIQKLPTIGRLNYSIIKDSNYWNEYSYIVNIKNEGDSISKERLQTLIRPMLHPLGLKDFYQESKVLFSQISETFKSSIYETPKIINYFAYSILSSENNLPDPCEGCLDLPQVPNTYKFPTWSLAISDKIKYPNGVTFGSINIEDFWELYPSVDGVFPNTDVTCSGC